MSEKPPLFKRLRAAKAYADFTGAVPTRSYAVQLDDKPVAGYRLGSLLGVAYEATRDGRKERYFHEFGPAARPDLAVKDDGSQLYITRGRYKVTDRGITDMPLAMIVNPSARPSLRKPRGTKTMRNRLGRFIARKRRPAARVTTVFRANPLPKRRRHKRRRAALPAVFRTNPVRRSHHRRAAIVRRRYRRNPIEGGRGNLRLGALVMPALGIGLGAVGSEMAMGYMTFIPANMKTGMMRHVTKGVISLGAGWVLGKFVNRKVGEAFALGGLTIAFHDAAKEAILKAMPNAQFGYYSPGQMERMGAYMTRNQMGMLPRGAGSPGGPMSFSGMGEYMRMGGHASDGGGSPEFGV